VVATPTPEPVEEADRIFRINEIMAVNGVPLVEGTDQRPDWIEIANLSGEDQDLSGWFLTDDRADSTKWQLPDVVVPSRGHVVVVASDRPVFGFEESFRAPFSLKSAGEFLALVEPNGLRLHHSLGSEYPEQRYNISYGFDASLDEYRYFTIPTPGAPNGGASYKGFAKDPISDVERGFHESPFYVALDGQEEATLHFTRDGTLPSETVDLYTEPLFVDGTTFVRALATRPDHLPSRVVTHTYVFLDDVLSQPALPEGFPEVWQPTLRADYAVDAGIASPEELKEALRYFPSLSLVMPLIDWFHNSTDPAVGGIYSNSTIARGREWERVGSAEFFDFEHGEEKQLDAGFRIYGNASRATSRPKHNLRLVFRREYGAGTLDFPIFGDDDVEESVKGLLLRGQNGDSWVHPSGTQRREALYIRDQFARSLHERMDQPETPQGHINLYINGLYWGLYHTIERIEDDSMASHFGGYEEDWDVIKSSPPGIESVAGTLAGWNELQTLAVAVGAGELPLSEIETQLDLENFIDFLLVNYWNGNRDWDHNNFQAAKRRTGGDRWRFFVWDSERTMLADNHNSTNKNAPNRATAIHHALLPIQEYKERFRTRVELHLGIGGALSSAGVSEEFLMWADLLRVPLLAESARWGDTHREGNPYTVDVAWQNEVDRRVNNYFPARTQTLLNQLDAHGLR
jgi:hypothetical protein